MGTSVPTEQQVELIMDLFKLKGSCTYKDIAEHFDVHYMTARDWVQELIRTDLIEKYPMKRGKQDVFIVHDFSGADRARPYNVMLGGQPITPARMVLHVTGPMMPPITGLLAQLYVRSFFHGNAQQEHLGGHKTALELRASLNKYVGMLRSVADACEELIAYRGPWEDTSEFAVRFGDVPDIQVMLKLAEEWRIYMGYQPPNPSSSSDTSSQSPTTT